MFLAFLRRERMLGLWCLGLMGAGSCAVFPDHATLPLSGAGVAGEVSAAQAGAPSGAGGAPTDGGGASNSGGTGVMVAAGAAGEGPNNGGTSAGGSLGGGGGTGGGGTGGGGTGGTATCKSPQTRTLSLTGDTWIESAKPGTNHGSDTELSVVGGSAERRALLALTLPAPPTGASLRKATFSLHLRSNADVTLAARTLSLYPLAQALDEPRATWTNYGNGNRKWTKPGGDFGSVFSSTSVRAKTSAGSVSFDVTAPIRQLLGGAAVPVSLIILETGTVPAPPAELAFASREGNALEAPALVLDFCAP